MTGFTEATVLGYFPDEVLLKLSRPLSGTRFRQITIPEAAYVGEILVAAFRNTLPQDIIAHVQSSLNGFDAVLVLEDDHVQKARAIRFENGALDADTGDS